MNEHRRTGHVIRIIGLVIEMLGVWGVYRASVNDSRSGSGAPQPGLVGRRSLSGYLDLAVGFGFVIWT